MRSVLVQFNKGLYSIIIGCALIQHYQLYVLIIQLLFTVYTECCSNSDTGDSSTIPSTAALSSARHMVLIPTIPKIRYMFSSAVYLCLQSTSSFPCHHPFGSSMLLLGSCLVSAGARTHTAMCPCHDLWPHDWVPQIQREHGRGGRQWKEHALGVGWSQLDPAYKTS